MDFKKKLQHKLFELSDMILTHYNPCQIEGSRCLAGETNPCCTKGTPHHPDLKRDDGLPGCRHTSGSGAWCKHPNLACKTWLCQTAIASTSMECFHSLCAIEAICKQFGWARPPYLGEGYIGADDKNVSEW